MRFCAVVVATVLQTGGAVAWGECENWPARLVKVKSSIDGSDQPCWFWTPEGVTNAVPLVVGLHTWSGSYRDTSHYKTVLDYAQKHGWAMVGPNFRGPNRTSDACGSDLAIGDVVDAVAYAKDCATIDENRVYVIGGSGGGHLTLLLAGRHPEIWAGCVACCPITDLARWHADSLADHPGRGVGYAKMMEEACGGTPKEKLGEYRYRSPLTWLALAKKACLPVYIVTGIHDGWIGSVPVGHAIRAFNALADEKDRVSEDAVDFIERTQTVPSHLAYSGEEDAFYGEKGNIHFRRKSDNVQLTLFEGGHDGNYAAGLFFLSRQRKGSPADFSTSRTGCTQLAAEALGK